MSINLYALKEEDKVFRLGRLGAIFLAVALLFFIIAFAIGPWLPYERVDSFNLMAERLLIVIGFPFLALGIYCWWKSGYFFRGNS